MRRVFFKELCSRPYLEIDLNGNSTVRDVLAEGRDLVDFLNMHHGDSLSTKVEYSNLGQIGSSHVVNIIEDGKVAYRVYSHSGNVIFIKRMGMDFPQGTDKFKELDEYRFREYASFEDGKNDFDNGHRTSTAWMQRCEGV